MEVEVVQWPTDRARVDLLRRRGIPRLLVVASGEQPPEMQDCLEDWVAAAASAGERDARTTALCARAEHHATAPVLDDDGLLHHRDTWVSLSPVERALARALLARVGSVVARETLADRAWPQGAPTRNALDVHVLRLRRRIAPLGLEIRTVRSRGYVLEAPAGSYESGRTETTVAEISRLGP